jgi:hypothetical protein
MVCFPLPLRLRQLFFFVMFLSTVKARKVHDCRNSWHSEWWPAKLVLWLGFTTVAFFAPSPLVQLYGQSPADHLDFDLQPALSLTMMMVFVSFSEKSFFFCREGRAFRSRVRTYIHTFLVPSVKHSGSRDDPNLLPWNVIQQREAGRSS